MFSNDNAVLSEEQHNLMDQLLGRILSRHKDGSLTTADAVAELAHFITAIDNREQAEIARALKASVAEERE